MCRCVPGTVAQFGAAHCHAADMTNPHDEQADTLLDLMEELVASIEQRDAGDPDAPAWEAERRIARLERELARRVRTAGSRTPFVMSRSEEALAGIV